jgi:hypothetical protein
VTSSKDFVRIFTKKILKSGFKHPEEIKRYPNWETVIDANVSQQVYYQDTTRSTRMRSGLRTLQREGKESRRIEVVRRMHSSEPLIIFVYMYIVTYTKYT